MVLATETSLRIQQYRQSLNLESFFSPEQTALLMTIYLALDGYGPACNVTGDGAVALIVDRIKR